MYKFNADLELQHISLGDRLATYVAAFDVPDGEIIHSGLCLVRSEGKHHNFVVASFDAHLCCNNAAGFMHEEQAWKDFAKMRHRMARDFREHMRNRKSEDEDLSKLLGL